jgi:hypothetical protein
MHEHLNKLRIISKLKESQKLDTTKGINIYTYSLYNWILRRWARENKEETIRTLRDLYKSFGQSVETVINDYTTHKKLQLVYVLINSAIELRASILGLDNLSKTYSAFPATTSALEGIVRDYIIVIYDLLLNTIPKENWPSEFNETIMYQNIIIYKGVNNIV